MTPTLLTCFLLALVTSALSIPARNELYENPWAAAYLRNSGYDEIDPRGLDGIGKHGRVKRAHNYDGILAERYAKEMHFEKDGKKERLSIENGGGNLIRNLELALRANPDLFSRPLRNLDSLSGVSFGSTKRYDPMYHKRNWDEIDHTGFNSFIKKRNFDEIDRSGFDGFVKKRNFDEIDRSGFDGFVKKRNFDEIDRSGFDGFVKRSALPQHHQPLKGSHAPRDEKNN